jgi:hypothetical protein
METKIGGSVKEKRRRSLPRAEGTGEKSRAEASAVLY